MPADIAFQIMGRAMKVTTQVDLAGAWEQKKQNMITATTVARQYVLDSNNRIEEENLKKNSIDSSVCRSCLAVVLNALHV